MTELNIADPGPPDRIALPAPLMPERRESWIAVAAAAVAITVVAGVLVGLLVNLRSDWVARHQQPMDKASAIHKIFFRD